jgi:hypothetical protein
VREGPTCSPAGGVPPLRNSTAGGLIRAAAVWCCSQRCGAQTASTMHHMTPRHAPNRQMVPACAAAVLRHASPSSKTLHAPALQAPLTMRAAPSSCKSVLSTQQLPVLFLNPAAACPVPVSKPSHLLPASPLPPTRCLAQMLLM